MCDDHTHDHDHRTHPAPTPGLRAELTRRGILSAAGSGLLMASLGGPALGAVSTGATLATGASRTSRLTRGTTLLHADLHNHSLMSDGDGDPAAAFGSMRAAGLDVAALTDHSTISGNDLADAIAAGLPPEVAKVGGLTPTAWRRTKALADAADEAGAFTALRGFEWSSPLLGHVNVWFTEDYVDLLEAPTMLTLWGWLQRSPSSWLGGGGDGIAGFNHPGREPLRFAEFIMDRRVREQVVSMEIFNRGRDFLFHNWSKGASSPLVACLNKGWRTGLLGVTDEHGTDWGFPEGKGRTGLWVTRHDRAGVREAMQARRFFATRTSGLRLDATATLDGSTARMGGGLLGRGGDVRIDLDLERDAEWRDKTLHAQVLRPGPRVPEVVHVEPFRPGRRVSFTVPMDVEDGRWFVVRVSDPTGVNASPGPAGHPCNDLGVAYTSPWWITPV